jgi:hypothetical protein
VAEHTEVGQTSQYKGVIGTDPIARNVSISTTIIGSFSSLTPISNEKNVSTENLTRSGGT